MGVTEMLALGTVEISPTYLKAGDLFVGSDSENLEVLYWVRKAKQVQFTEHMVVTLVHTQRFDTGEAGWMTLPDEEQVIVRVEV